MARELEPVLPDALVAEIEKELPRFNAVPLASLDRAGFPHVALLSYFEMIYLQDRLFFFINAYSNSARFLRERQRCTLIFVQTGFVYYVKGMPHLMGTVDSQMVFAFGIQTVLEDYPTTQEGKARLETGIRFDTGQSEATKRLELRAKIRNKIQE